jgi:hypothetical protein
VTGPFIRVRQRSSATILGVAAALGLALAPSRPLAAQGRPADSLTTRRPARSDGGPGVRVQFPRASLRLQRPAALQPLGRLAPLRLTGSFLAQQLADSLRASVERDLALAWTTRVAQSFLRSSPSTAAPLLLPAPTRTGANPNDTTRQDNPFGEYADLGLQLNARIEAKAEQNRNEQCAASQLFSPFNNCRGGFQPNFDFQFNVRSGGIIADRVHVNIDYDSQREFDASNNISVYYQGKPDELLHRVEIGNVSFAPPPSRFITSGIPSGNYGLQAIGQLGPMRFRSIVAQQKGNVIRDRFFTVGEQTLQDVRREVEDYQVEPRRFFFTIDPKVFTAEYPNIDILDRQQMTRLASSLADTLRPTRIYLYRLLIGGQPQNPNGPQFIVRGLANAGRGQVYEYLREGLDYYVDPSFLWVALVRPLNLNNERLVVAYRVRIDGRDTTYVNTGGTPDPEFTEREQFANLLYDPSIRPGDASFDREIRSIYRIGGEDVQRRTVDVTVVTGTGDQEKPVAGEFQTFLQMFGLAQSTNPAAFDVENRVWPRPSDPNFNVGGTMGGADAKIIRDYFLVLPSLQPFSDSGLVVPGNPSNSAIYSTPSEYLYSSQHPQTLYRMIVRYSSQGGGERGSLMLGSVQVRQNSERITVDGVPLRRDIDYTVDYELGRVSFTRGDTLFPRPRQVAVQYEENPLFAAAPTSILGIATEFPTENGLLTFTALSQSQRTTFTRPPLGLEPASSFLAGVSGNFTFDAAPLTRALDALPFVHTTALSRISLQGEFATSRPRPNSAGQAYVESFEGEGGITVVLDDRNWYYSSEPPVGIRLSARFGPAVFDVERAATMTWQTNIRDENGDDRVFFLDEIDPQTTLAGRGFSAPERLLWMTLFPRSVGGLSAGDGRDYRWTTPGGPPGRRWRSIRTSLNPSGLDLTRVEELEFWALIDTTTLNRAKNPTLVFDFGDISENSVAFAPTTLTVDGADSTYTGRTLQGYDVLNSERDPFSRSFNAAVNDVGLPGDVVDAIDVTGGVTGTATNLALCAARARFALRIGDTRANCTVRNDHLDEEDLDGDNVLNLRGVDRENEQFRRYVVDLADAQAYTRIGGPRQASQGGVDTPVRWVQFRVPFNAPSDSLGAPLLRRIRALRISMISGDAAADDEDVTVPIARLRLVGSPWLKRSERVLSGIAGDSLATNGGFVIASVIGTNDRDTTNGVFYQSPPGVVEQLETQAGDLQSTRAQINERSLRLLAGDLPLYDRAEAYYRFPEGEKNFMGYKELRLWARGRNNGWGDDGELQMYVKLGRDASNFYLYRTPVHSGNTREAWLPEVRVDFDRFYALRARLQNAYLQSSADSIACTGLDAELIARSGLPLGTPVRRFAACEDGYIVYTVDPGVSPPNLAAVQELAVGIVRVRDAAVDPTGIANPIAPGDTLELWVDDIRLGNVEDTPGYAGQIGLAVVAGDVADIRVNVSRKDPHFRQLAEQPSFITDDALDLASSVRLDKFLPSALGIALPFTVAHSSTSRDPLFLSRSDIRGEGIQGLRVPRTSATRYGLALRRVTPMRGFAAPILNNLALTGTYSTGDVQSEYQRETTSGYTVGADYLLAAAPHVLRFPGWFNRALSRLPSWLEGSEAGRALRDASLRWSPSQLRLTSDLVRTDNQRLSFLKPADAPDDDPRRVDGLVFRWRNGAALELRPFAALTARLDAVSIRDLRQFDQPTPVDSAATRERWELFGRDLGLERERTLSTILSFAPAIAAWLRPRVEYGSSFGMLRDPNSRSVVPTEDGTTFRLPRRLNASQNFTTAATVEPGRAIANVFGDSSMVRWLASALGPIDASYTRSLLSAYDGTPFNPPARFQFGWGNAGDFRSIEGRLATSAGQQQTFAVNGALNLPLRATLVSRFGHTESRNWTARSDNVHAEVENTQHTFPDLSLRWNFRPRFISAVISSLGANAGLRRTLTTSRVPGDVTGGVTEESRTETRSYPLNLSVAWGFGGLSTAAGYTRTMREDARPGSIGDGSSHELALDFGKSFRAPVTWNLRSDIRTRVGFQRSRSQNFVVNGSTGKRSALADNGRTAFSLNADSDVAENMAFSLQGSRVVSFDRNFNRRFTQTVITAVLNLQFFAGELR